MGLRFAEDGSYDVHTTTVGCTPQALGSLSQLLSLNSPFTTFPLAFLGSSVTNSTSLGTL